MARPRYHALLTAPVAWVAYRRWGAGAAVGALAAGVFVDLDHLVDYAWVRLRGERTHYFAPLHGWELALAAAAFALWPAPGRHPYAELPDVVVKPPSRLSRLRGREWLPRLAAGLSAGMVAHLAQDLVTNRPRHPGVYALSYRVARRFRREATGWGEHTGFHQWSDLPWYRWF